MGATQTGPAPPVLAGLKKVARVVIIAGAAVLGSGCNVTPDYVLEDGRRRRLEAAGVETFDSAGDFKLAGMSAIRDIEVEPLDKSSLGGDTLSAAYRTFTARCGACHDVPNPRSKRAYAWRSDLRRMSHNQERAGLLPMTPEQRSIVLRYLERHAR